MNALTSTALYQSKKEEFLLEFLNPMENNQVVGKRMKQFFLKNHQGLKTLGEKKKK